MRCFFGTPHAESTRLPLVLGLVLPSFHHDQRPRALSAPFPSLCHASICRSFSSLSAIFCPAPFHNIPESQAPSPSRQCVSSDYRFLPTCYPGPFLSDKAIHPQTSVTLADKPPTIYPTFPFLDSTRVTLPNSAATNPPIFAAAEPKLFTSHYTLSSSRPWSTIVADPRDNQIPRTQKLCVQVIRTLSPDLTIANNQQSAAFLLPRSKTFHPSGKILACHFTTRRHSHFASLPLIQFWSSSLLTTCYRVS